MYNHVNMSRFQMIKRMYCTPIGNYSFIRKTTSQKAVEQIQEETNQTKNKSIDTNVTKLNNKKS